MTAPEKARARPRTLAARAMRPAFLEALGKTGNVTAACMVSGLSRSGAYQFRRDDPDFLTAWESAMEKASDFLELEARRRATEGVEEPVYGRIGKDKDGQIGTITRYSDRLLEFLLRGAKPERYRERRDVTASVQVNTVSDLVAKWAKEEEGEASASLLIGPEND